MKTDALKERHGGQILVDQLAIQGVERVFQVPGESFLAALDGLHGKGIDVVTCRQEGGCAMMADADGRMTGKPGVAFVTRGPGATNATAGIHIAQQDSIPMILFVGQIPAEMRDREAFQEVDFRAFFGPIAKAVFEIDDTARIPEYVSRAFHTAVSGRPGPVVISLPETMLSAKAVVADVPPAVPARTAPDPALIEATVARLKRAERPLIVVGGPTWSDEGAAALSRFAAAADIPVSASLRCQDYFDMTLPHAVGDLGVLISPKLKETVTSADVVLVIGPRLGEMTTQGYTMFHVPDPEQDLIHVHPDPDEIGTVYRADIAIASDTTKFVTALEAAWPASNAPAPWADWRASARANYEAWREPQESAGDVKLEGVWHHLADRLPADAIITNGAGNYSGWLSRYYRFRRFRTLLAPTSGSMGYGLPAAVAAKLRHPERIVLAVAGDGCFQMTCQEFGTAAQMDAAVIVMICDNGQYGTIRMHQEREYPGRIEGTRIVNPDFAKWAESYGGFGAHVHRTEEFADALEAAVASGKPAILHLHTDPRAISVMKSLPA